MPHEELMDLRRAIRERGHRWTAGRTRLSVLSHQEQNKRLGLRLMPEERVRLQKLMKEAPPQAVSVPPSWDWRNVEGADWTTPIQDQQACGACVAFALVATLEVMLKRHHQNADLQPDLSEAHLFFCGCGSCCEKGWWPPDALDYARRCGVPDEACFPYRGADMSCSTSCNDWQSRAVRVEGWRQLLPIGARKEWLATKGPLIGCMAVYRDFFSYTSGIYEHTSGELAGYHAVCVVGYSEEDRAWICKNSWGTGWGELGWFKLAYGQCSIDSLFPMYAIEGALPPGSEPPEPEPGSGCNLVRRIQGALQRS